MSSNFLSRATHRIKASFAVGQNCKVSMELIVFLETPTICARSDWESFFSVRISFDFYGSACSFYSATVWKNRLCSGSCMMNENLVLQNHLKEIRTEKKLSQSDLAQMVGVSRNTISSIETLQFCPTAKLALILCVALDKKFEDIFYF